MQRFLVTWQSRHEILPFRTKVNYFVRATAQTAPLRVQRLVHRLSLGFRVGLRAEATKPREDIVGLETVL